MRATAPATAPSGRRRVRALAPLLTHPLVVLAIGAVLSGLIVPTLTRRWQDHAQQLQIKTDLVTGMSEATTRALVGLAPPAGAAADTRPQVYAQWSIDSAVIWSKLAAYFPGDPLVDAWSAFAQTMDDFYDLSRASTAAAQATTAQAICRYLGAQGAPCPAPASTVPWDTLGQAMRQIEVGIVDRVLAHGMSL